ncbi:MAG: AsnC family transcriptional regulator [Armatimonadetes bacterium]|nr:AsnC family transcriptional regulator [Armatimonadota bacterium]
MDYLDRQILNIIQTDFPLESRPFQTIAERLGTTESEILLRVRQLIESGVIRKIGPVFDSRKLGYESTLIAMKVPENRLLEVATIVNEFPQVTHNYGRRHKYNLWFTLVCQNSSEIDNIVSQIRAKTGISDIYLLPAERMFKIDVNFRF